jgi:ligand-binding SRPBCC domain-containing protein
MMRVHVLRREQVLPVPRERAWAFLADPFNLEAITPPLLGFEVITAGPIRMDVGTRIQYRLRVHGVPVRWHTLIEAWDPPHRFVDLQVRGPYRLWHHTHELLERPGGRALMRDTVRYAIGWGPVGALAHALLVRRDVEAIFAFRAGRVAALLDGDEAVEDEVDAGHVAQ